MNIEHFFKCLGVIVHFIEAVHEGSHGMLHDRICEMHWVFPSQSTAKIRRCVPGDVVIDVQKLEPVAAGSRTCVLTDKSFPVHAKNIRKMKIKLNRQARRSRRVRARHAPRDVHELPEEELQGILASLKDANCARCDG